MNNIFKLKNSIILNRNDIESFYVNEDGVNPYNLELVVNMKSGNHIKTYIQSSEFDQFYKEWSEWMNIPFEYKGLPKYKIIDNETKPFIYKNLIIREPESIKALDLVKEGRGDDWWYIVIMFDHTDFNIYFNEDEMEESTPEEREKEARRVYNQLKKWVGFSEQFSSKEETNG